MSVTRKLVRASLMVPATSFRRVPVLWLASFVLSIVGTAISLPAQSLLVSPPDSLVDEPLKVRVTGLKPNHPIIIRGSTQDADGRTWRSYVGVMANRRGVVDLSTQPPTNGTYTGVDAMGLIWSMNLPGGDYNRVRFSYKGVEPLTFRFTVEVDGVAVGETEATRRFVRPEVKILDVRSDGLVGKLFMPSGNGPFPAIIVLGGSEGGLGSEDAAALLASHGYATLALAYFGIEGLPTALEEIPLEYFKRAIEWLMAQKSVRPGGLALVGTSKGAEAALLLGAHYKEVKAVVAYSPSGVAWSCICSAPDKSSWYFQGKPVPFIPQDTDPTYRPPQGFPIRPAINYLYRLRNPKVVRKAVIPVGQIKGPVLLISGSDDQLWPSSALARMVFENLKSMGHPYPDQLLNYEGAGHLIGKAYLPVGSTLVAGGRLDTGGTLFGNAKAQAKSWPRVLSFLKDVWRAHPRQRRLATYRVSPK